MNATALHRLALVATFLFALLNVHSENYPYRSDVLWVTVPNHADWVYRTGEKASIEVQFYKYGIPRNAEVHYELAHDNLPAFKKGSFTLKNGRATLSAGTLTTPGFLDCRLTARLDGTTYRHHIKVAFSPENIVPFTREPADFITFWQQAVEQMRKTPLVVTAKRSEKYSDDGIETYLVKIKVDAFGRSVYGYLMRPKAPGRYPVVLCPPGAGVKTLKDPMANALYPRNGLIKLVMEIHGLNPETDPETFNDMSKAFGAPDNGYLANNLDDRNTYYMKHVYLACVRAIDYLTSLPEWDGKNVITQGGSQGGALSLITAGLDKRVTLAVANYPALSDMVGYYRGGTGGYPHFSRPSSPGKSAFTPTLNEQRAATLAYFDVVNFARHITCPVRMTWGYNDDVCPPTTSYAVYNLITSPKEALITPINEHWASTDTERSHVDYIKTHLLPAAH